MKEKPFDVVLFIGRFQPVHNAHIQILKRATELANKVVVVVGSANQPRTFKNPWTAIERIEMIQRALAVSDIPLDSIAFETNIDTPYNDSAWAVRIQDIAHKYQKEGDKLGIIGHKKEGDESTFYLDMFPQWEFIDQGLVEILDATSIRTLYFSDAFNRNFLQGVLPISTLNKLECWKATEEYADLMKEREFSIKYKQQFASLPYPPVFVTTDAIIIQSGHVLMIKRRDYPGKGLWALPGGFLDANGDRSLKDCMIRELKEETGIKVAPAQLRGSVTEVEVFDSPSRSTRGRTITHAFKIELPAGALPKVKGGDDAEKAKWIPISELNSLHCYDDHYEIIQHFNRTD